MSPTDRSEEPRPERIGSEVVRLSGKGEDTAGSQRDEAQKTGNSLKDQFARARSSASDIAHAVEQKVVPAVLAGMVFGASALPMNMDKIDARAIGGGNGDETSGQVLKVDQLEPVTAQPQRVEMTGQSEAGSPKKPSTLAEIASASKEVIDKFVDFAHEAQEQTTKIREEIAKGTHRTDADPTEPDPDQVEETSEEALDPQRRRRSEDGDA